MTDFLQAIIRYVTGRTRDVQRGFRAIGGKVLAHPVLTVHTLSSLLALVLGVRGFPFVAGFLIGTFVTHRLTQPDLFHETDTQPS